MSLENPLVSVIIPIYKVEKYIDKCVKSVLAQTYQNLEVILVDDGSSDGCPRLCDEYKSIDHRVKVIHKPNGGLSDARNIGIKNSTGEYFLFVDGDDWIADNLVEIAIQTMQEYSVDIVSFSANIIENNVIVRQEFMPYSETVVLSAQEATENVLKDSISSQVWLRLYNRKCWKEIEFPMGRLYEDIATTYKVFELANNGICFIPYALYNYLHNCEGISLSNNPRKVYHIFLGLKEHYEYACDRYPEAINDSLYLAMINGMSVINCSLNNENMVSGVVESVDLFLRSNKGRIMGLQKLTAMRRFMLNMYYFSFPLYRLLAKLLLCLRKTRKSKG